MNARGQWPRRARIYDGGMSEGEEGRTSGIRGVKSAARTVALLELLAARGDRPARLDELAAELGVPRSSMYQLLQTLVECRWVRTDVTGSLYGIGIRALLTGTSYLDTDRRVRVIRPYLDEASDALGETIHLARFDGPDVVYLATRESHEYVRTISRVGRRVPAHAGALGKALLAERPDAELPLPAEPFTALTEHTHTDRAVAAGRPGAGARARLLDRTRGDGAGDRGLRLRLALRQSRRSTPSAARFRWPGSPWTTRPASCPSCGRSRRRSRPSWRPPQAPPTGVDRVARRRAGCVDHLAVITSPDPVARRAAAAPGQRRCCVPAPGTAATPPATPPWPGRSDRARRADGPGRGGCRLPLRCWRGRGTGRARGGSGRRPGVVAVWCAM